MDWRMIRSKLKPDERNIPEQYEMPDRRILEQYLNELPLRLNIKLLLDIPLLDNLDRTDFLVPVEKMLWVECVQMTDYDMPIVKRENGNSKVWNQIKKIWNCFLKRKER